MKLVNLEINPSKVEGEEGGISVFMELLAPADDLAGILESISNFISGPGETHSSLVCFLPHKAAASDDDEQAPPPVMAQEGVAASAMEAKLADADTPRRRTRRTKVEMAAAEAPAVASFEEESEEKKVSDVDLTKAASRAAEAIGPVRVMSVVRAFTGGMVNTIPDDKRNEFLAHLDRELLA